jgi:putative salt-induced outer membrane protein YdiY
VSTIAWNFFIEGIIMTRILLSAIALSLASAGAVAHPVTKQPSPWKGSKASFGMVSNVGNSDSSNTNASGTLSYTHKEWEYTASMSYQHARDSKAGETANNLYTLLQAKYHFSRPHFVYGRLDSTNNKFDGYDYIYNESVGYGVRLLDMPTSMKLDLYGGPGLQQTKVTDGDKKDMVSAQMGMQYVWTITTKTDFSQSLEVTTSSQDTRYMSKTGLITTLSSNLGFEVSFLAIKDSNPVENKKGLNTTTAVQLVYNF